MDERGGLEVSSVLSRVVAASLCLTLVLATSKTGADAPPGRYTYPAMQTVHDTMTTLTWTQAASPGTLSQADASTYCSGQTLAGSGWRLPTVKELLTLVDYSQTGGGVPMIDPTAFPSMPSAAFWSATSVAGSPGNAWSVDFSAGLTSEDAVTTTSYVLCVR
jgi:hypothetical protein